MKIYKGKTKKYRIIEVMYSNNDTEYFIQWKGCSWYNIFWFGGGDKHPFNRFCSFIEAEKSIVYKISADIKKHALKNYTQKCM